VSGWGGTSIAFHQGTMVRTLLALALVSAGCAASGPSARVTAAPPPLQPVAGGWSGTYSVDAGPGSGGTIAFTLDVAEDVASGHLLLTPEGQQAPVQPAGINGPAPDAAASADAASPQPLALRLLAASDGLIYADADTYWDAARETSATLTLRGKLDGDAIRGTFRTTYADGSAQTLGRWSVTRTSGS
jgi:hypothetical protein